MTDGSEAHELDNEDTGGFSNPAAIGDLKYEELEALVFNALDNDYRTLLRIKEHAGLERSFDLAPVIEGMELDRKIRRYENGTITAFFRPHHKPKRFWTNGDGTVGVEWDEKFIPRDDEAKAKELAGYGDPLREKDENMKEQPAKIRSKDLLDEEVTTKTRRDRITLTLQAVEKVAAQHYTQKAVGEALGTSQRLICRRLQKDPDFKAAFERGRKKYLADHPDYSPVKKREGSRKLLVDAVAKRQTKAAGENGSKPAKRPRKASAKAKREPIRKAEPSGNGSRDLPATPSDPTPVIDDPPRSAPVHSRYITLAGGSQFLVAFEGNIFTAGPRDLAFIRRINELLDEFSGLDTRELDEGVRWTGVVR